MDTHTTYNTDPEDGKMKELEAAIKMMRSQGADISQFRNGLAARYGVSVEDVDAIAEENPGRILTGETAAEAALLTERKYRSQNRADARRYDHEED